MLVLHALDCHVCITLCGPKLDRHNASSNHLLTVKLLRIVSHHAVSIMQIFHLDITTLVWERLFQTCHIKELICHIKELTHVTDYSFELNDLLNSY